MAITELRRPKLPADVATSRALLEREFGGPETTRRVLAGTEWPGAAMLAAPQPGRATAHGRSSPVLPRGAVRLRRGIFTALDLLQAMQNVAQRQQVESAIRKLGLDRNDATHVLSAQAYVWSMTNGWSMFEGVPASGRKAEHVAEAIAQFERANPGAAGYASHGDRAMQARLVAIARAAVAEVGGPPRIVHEKRASEVDEALSTDSAVARGILRIRDMPEWEAHHVIPFASVAALPHHVQRAIVAADWRMDSRENLIALPSTRSAYENAPNLQVRPMHRGKHSAYNTAVSLALSFLTRPNAPLDKRSVAALLARVDAHFRNQLINNRNIWHPRVR